MKQFLLVSAMLMLGLTAQANGEYDDDEGGSFNLNFQHQKAEAKATAKATASARGGNAYASGGESYNEGNNAELGLALNQDIDLTENPPGDGVVVFVGVAAPTRPHCLRGRLP